MKKNRIKKVKKKISIEKRKGSRIRKEKPRAIAKSSRTTS